MVISIDVIIFSIVIGNSRDHGGSKLDRKNLARVAIP